MPYTAAASAGGGPLTKPRYEIGDIFREYGQSYRRKRSLPVSHLKVMRAIEICRTAELGGHLERCDRCGFERNAYNSCRNRHCPKCQALAKAEWLEKRRAELLPVEYFHNIFTLPHELNPLALCNKTVLYDILFKAVAHTLQEFVANPKYRLGGKIGFTAILHTWDQKLLSHMHLHCVIPAGVLSCDGERWIPVRRRFLFPVKALSRMFRGTFIAYLKKAFRKRRLIFPGQLASLAVRKNFMRAMDRLWEKEWVVYSKAPFNGPQKVLDYLGRYTHRVAIANHRIVNVENGLVTFRYRDRKDGDKSKRMTIDAEEFIHRFLLHVIPDSYKRIRHFGFLANRCKKQQLRTCRELLGLCPEPPQIPVETVQEKMLRLTGVDITECPRCKQGRMKRVMELPILNRRAPMHRPTITREAFDTS